MLANIPAIVHRHRRDAGFVKNLPTLKYNLLWCGVMSQALSEISRGFFRRVYGKDMYAEPALTFMPIVKEHLSDNGSPKKILDAACGYNNSFLGSLIKNRNIRRENLTGMDIDPDVRGKNPLHDNIVIQDMHVPLEGHKFDAVMSQYTWEHLHDPKQVLFNLSDMVKPGGKVVIVAPQRYDYVSTIERMLPPKLKNFAWKLLKGRDVMPYPAFFRLCTEKELRKYGKQAGFDLVHYTAHSAAPIWFQKVPPLFVIMCLVMTIFNRVALLSGLRSTFIAVLQKQTPEDFAK